MTGPVPPQQAWPPPWARSTAFFVGIALMCWESVIDKGTHLFIFGPAFMLTGLPIARGVEVLVNKLPWGQGGPPPPPPPPAAPQTEEAKS